MNNIYVYIHTDIIVSYFICFRAILVPRYVSIKIFCCSLCEESGVLVHRLANLQVQLLLQ